MDWPRSRSICEGSSGESCKLYYNKDKKTKPIEVYVFIDPVCPDCWGLEPITKKLVAQYGDYFTMRYMVGTSQGTIDKMAGKKIPGNQGRKIGNLKGVLSATDIPSSTSTSPYNAAIAIKAAELQGKGAGRRFLRVLHERLFIEERDILSSDVLLKCAELAKLDLDEFKKDFVSKSPLKALQCDQKMMVEMGVKEFPTVVAFNIQDDKEGIKISGNYPYRVYVHILEEALGKTPTASKPPSIKEFMEKYQFVETKEISTVYDITDQDTLIEMKKLKLKQIVEPVKVKSGLFWRYIGQ